MEKPQAGRRAITNGPMGDAVAENLARMRERRGMTTRQLSAELDKLGRPIPASGITRIEKGQRTVTVDDLVSLGKALRVPPILLLFPLGKNVEVQLPGETMSPWGAVLWFAGERQPAGEEEFGGGEYDEQFDIYEWYDDPWTVESRPVKLFRRHQQEVLGWWNAIHLIRVMTGQIAGHPPMIAELENLSDDSKSKWFKRLKGYYERQIKLTRSRIREHGLTPPLLDQELADLDDNEDGES